MTDATKCQRCDRYFARTENQRSRLDYCDRSDSLQCAAFVHAHRRDVDGQIDWAGVEKALGETS